MDNYAPNQPTRRSRGRSPISALLIAVFAGVAFLMIAGMFYKKPGAIQVLGEEKPVAAPTEQLNKPQQQNRSQGQRRAERPLPDISILGSQSKPSTPLGNRRDLPAEKIPTH